jgi:hypothetical protein
MPEIVSIERDMVKGEQSWRKREARAEQRWAHSGTGVKGGQASCLSSGAFKPDHVLSLRSDHKTGWKPVPRPAVLAPVAAQLFTLTRRSRNIVFKRHDSRNDFNEGNLYW